MLSHLTGGPVLLIVSGVVLAVAGPRVGEPIEESAREPVTRRCHNRLLLVAATALAGVFTALLANGGAFLLVPLYLLGFRASHAASGGQRLGAG